MFKAWTRMQIDHKEQVSTFKDEHLILLRYWELLGRFWGDPMAKLLSYLHEVQALAWRWVRCCQAIQLSGLT